MFTDQHRKMLQGLIADPRWVAVQEYFDWYMKQNFTEQSIKRDDEFNTLWEAASAEGGKMHLQAFFDGFITEAKRV